MSEEKWAKFFELLDEIVNQPKPTSAKAQEVEEQAETQNSKTSFEEFIGWFGGDATEEVM